MSLFQKSVLKKYLSQQDNEAVVKAFKKFTKYFHDPKIQENIRSSKEEEYQGIFLTELFSKVLGYTMKPNANFNLVAEYKNEKNSKKADGAIIKDGKAIAVIELKGTNTKDLEKVRQQAFDYKANQTACVYVITSNFEKIRFYINNAVDFEEFYLFNLNLDQFKLLYLCLAKDNVLENTPLRIKEASIQEEEAITKKFYADYSLFKRELFRDLVKLNMNNDVFRTELNNEDSDRGTKNIKRTLFKKSQKLIDRFLFIFFAEDRGLLPPNSTLKILEQWDKLKELDEHVPLYKRYKKYFDYLDQGRKGTDKTAEIFAYNGGLFKTDAVLDSLLISDELLYKHTKDLSNYDFESQVDVNILGHIFENSLNEIESVNAEIEGTDFDKQKTKRKKDGVFYTPKYITKYIVDNTVGKLCAEKKAELKIVDEDFHPKRQKETKKKLLAALDTYREWLLQLTILDPACGSGAFLNQALDILIKEHQHLDELQTKLLGGGLVFPNIETTVLENNIFGVDLNEESVEIAKLSLWLRTAQPRRKLNNLSSNIKCGNSLIDSKAVAGDKAFKWEDEFAHIFKEKDKKAFHITTATHNSRYSQRMFDNHVKLDEAVYVDEKDEIVITETIAEIVKKDNLNVIEYNICGDHMHLLLVCDEDELTEIVGKIKAMSSRAANIAAGRTIPESKTRGHVPLSSTGKKKYNSLWTQKFGKSEIKDENYLNNAIEYIRNNRIKHELPKSKGIEKLKKEFLCSKEHAFRKEVSGGFDVVIGNPPYGAFVSKEEKEYYKKYYKVTEYNFDTYNFFFERSIDLLKEGNLLGFITPNTFLVVENGKKLRDLLFKQNTLVELFEVFNVFPDAVVEPINIILKKTPFNREVDFNVLLENRRNKEIVVNSFKQSSISKNKSLIFNYRETKEQGKVYRKIKDLSNPLVSFATVTTGIKPYQKGKGIPKQDAEIVKQKPFTSFKGGEGWCPLVRGTQVNRYLTKWDGEYVFYGDWLAEPRKSEIFFKEKLLIRRTDDNLMCTYDDKKFIGVNSVHSIQSSDAKVSNKYLLSLINSKVSNWFFRHENFHMVDKPLAEVKVVFVERLPVIISKDQSLFIDKVDLILCNAVLLQNKMSNFKKYIQSQYPIEKLSKKLQKWHDLEFGDFIKELNKANTRGHVPLADSLDKSLGKTLGRSLGKTLDKALGRPLDKKEEFEWMELFEEKKAEAQKLKAEIDKTDKEIDQMVYELYGLTDEEIQIVETA